MKAFEKPGGGFVLVNDATAGIAAVPGAAVTDKARATAASMIHLSRRKKHETGPSVDPSGEMYALATELRQERAAAPFCLSPLVVTHKGEERLSYPLTRAIVARFPLAQDLKSKLANAGLYGFLGRFALESNVVSYRAYIDLLLASLCLSTHGADKTADISPAAFRCWLSSFRTPDSLRWRDELWGAGRAAHFQCLREFTRAYARFANAPELAALAGQVRLAANGTTTWEKFSASAEGNDAEWLAFFDDWRSSTRANRNESRQMLRHLARWSREAFPGSSVAEVMTARVRTPKLSERLRASAGSNLKLYANMLRLAQRFSSFLEDELRGMGVGDALWPLVTQSEADAAAIARKGAKAGARHAESRSCPLPPQFQPIVEEILAEGEDGWPGKCGLFHETLIDARGRGRRVYCPVLPIFYRAMLILPLRGAQMARLDSGEGDEEMFDGAERQWKPNASRLAGYWKKQGDRHGTLRGFARREGDPAAFVTGFHINTSKTGNPYVVPWEHPKLHRMLWELRLWQEEHHPVTVPVEPEFYGDQTTKVSEERIETMPAIFALFRLLGTGRNRGISSPPSHRKREQAWQEIMAETEKRWNERNPADPVTIVKRNAKTKQPYAAAYNVHGLRVAGLTRLFMSGVPLEVLSKLVAGHRGLLMTLYYIKFKPSHVHKMLEEAEVRSDAAAAQGFMSDMRDWTIEQARKRAAFLQDDGVAAAAEMDGALKMMFTDVKIGMCPWAGTRCSDGGSLDRSVKRGDGVEQMHHKPVEGGEKNCIMCRHLVSGPPWMKQLWLFGTALFERFSQAADRTDELDRRKEAVVARRNAASQEAERAFLQREEAALDIQRDALASAQLLTLTSIDRVKRLLAIAEEIRLRNGSAGVEGGVDLVAQDAASVVEFMECDDFERSSVITASSRVYPMMHDAKSEARRDAFLDRMMWENGGTPLTFAPLTEEQKRFAQDSLARLLMEKLEREETRAVIEGRLRLEKMGLVEDVERIARQELGRPLPLNAVELSGVVLLPAGG